MMPTLSLPISRTLAVVLLIGLLAIAYLAIAQPIIDARIDQHDEIANLENALQRYQRVAAQRTSREAALAELKQRASGEDGLLRGANETLMAAAIQNRLKALIDESHGELKSIQILPPQADGPLRRIAVRGQISVTVEAAQRVFHDLEGGDLLLFLDNIGIRSRDDSRRRRERAPDGLLEVRLDVYGYAQPQQ